MRVIRSAGQNVSPSDDGRLYDQIFTDGLFEDATVTALGGNNIALSALYGVICGRDFTAEAQTINATLPEADTANGYIYVEIDTSSDDIITIGTALAPFTPTYENINTNGAVAQMVIATYEASAVAVTSVTATYAKASAGGVGSLAAIEASPATANHSVGSFLVYNGTLYKVTRAIAAGESLVVGTNIASASVGAELTSLNNGLKEQDTVETLTCASANTAVTIGSYTMRLLAKRLLYFSVTYTISSQVSAYGNLFTLGGKSANIGWHLPIFTAGLELITNNSIYGDAGNANARASRNMSAGTYRVSGIIMVNKQV